MRGFPVLPAFLAIVLVMVCRNVLGACAVQCSVVYVPWFAAAPTCQVCEFVAVVAFVDSSRFGVVSGVAVVASEGYAVGLVVICVCLVAKGDHYGAVVDVVQGTSCD